MSVRKPFSLQWRAALVGATTCTTLLALATSPQSRAQNTGSCLPSLWGGKNEATTYSAPYAPWMGTGSRTAQSAPSGFNLNTPTGTYQPSSGTLTTQHGSIPVQVGPNGVLYISQANTPGLPTSGAIGTVDQPATQYTPEIGVASGDALRPGTQVLYALPTGTAEIDPLRPNARVAVSADLVAAGTPGAVPVSVRHQVAYHPESEYRWTFDWTTNTELKKIEVIHPRTGRVVRTFYRQEEVRSFLPWFHQKEIVHYRPVSVPIATPVNRNRVRSTLPGAGSAIPSGEMNYPPAGATSTSTTTVN